MLNNGDPAPAFSVPDETGRMRTLDEFRGRKLVLWFYPKADTPGCTMEGCAFRDHSAQFEQHGAAIVGVSFDDAAANRAFKDKQRFPFPLLCDTDRRLGLAYGACKDPSARYPDRITVVIDEQGRVAKVYPKVDPRTHVPEVLDQVSGKKKGLLGRLFGG